MTGKVTVMCCRAVMVRPLARVGRSPALAARVAPGWGGSSVTGPAKVMPSGRVSEMTAPVQSVKVSLYTVRV